MLVQFSFQNFKCFKEEVKLSLIASNYDKGTKVEENIFTVEKFGLKLLRSAIVYGANASGKTKLMEGLEFMRNFILSSARESQIDEPIQVSPFLLSSETDAAPSTFEIIFIQEEVMYRYGFEVDKEKVHAEWLYAKTKIKEVELFYRDFQSFEIHKTRFKVADLVANDRIRPNALLLSVAASWNDKLAKQLFNWWRNCNIISGLREDGYKKYAVERISENMENKAAVVKFLKSADLGIEDIQVRKADSIQLSESLVEDFRALYKNAKQVTVDVDLRSGVFTAHKKYDANNLFEKYVELSMEHDESSGTKKYFALSGLVLETLEKGEILMVDELANKLHPNLVGKLIEIFNSKANNPKNAQLIFNTHDTSLLSSGLFRRDQIWFTQKDRYGASSLYSLSDFKGVRKGEDYEKNYVNGKYGAVPYLGDFEKLVTL